MRSIITHMAGSFIKIPGYKKIAWPVFVVSSLSLILILIFQSDNVSTFPIGWDKTFQVTPFDINIKNIKLSRRGNIIALTYEGEQNKSSGIYVSLSFDEGKNFLQPVRIASISSITECNPDISVSMKGQIAVVWQELTEEDPDSHIYYSISGDMGATWAEPARVISQTEMELMPRVLYDEKGGLHIFYSAYKDKGFSLFHIISGDENKFTEPASLVNISEGLKGAFFPAIHSTNSYIYIVWQGKEKIKETVSDYLYFIRSSDYGKNWTSKKLITQSKGKDSTPYIVTSNKDIYLVYQNDEMKNWGIRFVKGKDRGNTWDEPVVVSTTNADCYSPGAVLAEDDNLLVTWYDMRNNIPGVYAKKISLQSRNQISEVMLSRSNVPARKPLAISLGRKIMVFWEESGRLMAKNTDVHAEPPILYSKTHPENEWSKASTAVIKWQTPADESNITGYAYFLKNAADAASQDIDPTIVNINGNAVEFRTPELEDGVSYFYIRSVDGAGNYSRTIRYKILVSKNPPSMPVVKSSTHPDGKPVDSINAAIGWTMQDPARIKGYLYSIAKDTITKPGIFTTDNEIKFDNLPEGRHFFAIQAIDKTNMTSRIATYQIIVGKAEYLDPDVYRRIASGDIVFKKEIIREVKQVVIAKIPSVELHIPFDTTTAYNKPSFNIEINPKDIRDNDIIGYSYYIGEEEGIPADRINLKTKSISIENLEDGEYYISAKGMYYQYKNNVKEFKWTEPATRRFTISTVHESPEVAYLGKIIERLSVDYMAVSVSIAAMILSIFTIGFGSRLSFYFKLMHLKFANIFRIF